MLQAFQEMKKMNGGIVLVENDEVVCSIKLPIGGGLSDKPMEELIEEELLLKKELSCKRIISMGMQFIHYYFYSQRIYHMFELLKEDFRCYEKTSTISSCNEIGGYLCLKKGIILVFSMFILSLVQIRKKFRKK